MKKMMMIICLSVLTAAVSGCAVTVEYMVTEAAPGGTPIVTHYVKYSRPILVGQEIGKLSLRRDKDGNPSIELLGQK